MTARRLTARQAQAVIDAAVLVKAPDWADTRAWHVMSSDVVLVIVTPSYGGTRRNGWRWQVADHAAPAGQPEPTREKAAIAGLGAWRRQATH
jgi:hypothetical protein